MTVGQRIAELLAGEGVKAFFSLPEVSVGILHAALEDQGIKMFAPRHEIAASLMAEAYAMATGGFTIVNAACGPGVTNLYSAIANAERENAPVLYVTTERRLIPRASSRSGRFQHSINSLEIVRPMTKWATILEDGRLTDEVFQEAFRQLTTGKPGPVYIGLPFDMVAQEFEFGPLTPPQRYRPAAFTDTFPSEAIDDVVRQIRAASNPVILGGSGVRFAGAKNLFRELVEAAGCPVIVTPGGQGILPLDHPLYTEFHQGPGRATLAEADLIMTVGSSLNEKVGFGGNPNVYGQPDFPDHFVKEDRKWIMLDSEIMNVGRNRPIDTALLGDLRIALPKLTKAFAKSPVPEKAKKRTADLSEARRAAFDKLAADAPAVSPLHMGKLFVEVQKALPEGSTIVLDGGTSRTWAISYLYGPYNDVLKPMKMGNIGVGIGYANGYCAANGNKGKPLCMIGGDCSHGFYPMEMETAVRYGFPIIHVVTDDQGWGLEEPYYRFMTGRTFEVDVTPARLDELARSLGAHGEYCDKPEEIGPAMQRALESGKPAIVQIAIDRKISTLEIPSNDFWTRWHSDSAIYKK